MVVVESDSRPESFYITSAVEFPVDGFAQTSKVCASFFDSPKSNQNRARMPTVPTT